MADEEATLQDGELSLDNNASLDVADYDDGQEHSSDDSDVSEKRVKDAQRAFHEEAQKRAELEKQIEKMSGQLSTLTELVGNKHQSVPQAAQENPFEFLDDEKFKEGLLDSSENVATAIKRVVGEIGKTLHLRDQMLLQELNSRDPEIKSAAEQIRQFRQENPDLQDLSDMHIAKIMKKMGGGMQPESKKRVLAIGNRPQTSAPEDEELQKQAKMWYDRIGYGLYKDLENRRKKK
jgi:ABC-type transporter Mla subunit MlaD